MIVIDREVGRSIQRHLIELVIGTRDGDFTVQVDARTFRWEVATVETVIGPAVVEAEVIRRKTVIIAGRARRLANRIQVTPHGHLRLHIGQVVMHVT